MAREKKEGFNPNGTMASEGTIETFYKNAVQKDTISVPGIGDKNKEKLKDVGIETTHQLIGTFLTMVGEDMTHVEIADAFWFFLKGAGISQYRDCIVTVIGEKVNKMIPNSFDMDKLKEELESIVEEDEN